MKLVRLSLFALLAAWGLAAFAAPKTAEVLTLSSNQVSYTVGEQATLRAQLNVRATDPALRPFFKANLNGQPVSVAVVENAGFSVPEAFTVAGAYTWEVQAYFENANIAKEFEATIQQLEARNEEIDELLLKETDLDIIEQLEKEKLMNLFLLDQASLQLEKNRQPVGNPKTYSFTVN